MILRKFINMWDHAALEVLGSEFSMMDLMYAQSITSKDNSSILDEIVFDDNTEIEVPSEANLNIIKYFKAPWS